MLGAVFRSARVGDPSVLIALGALPLTILPRLVTLRALLRLLLLTLALLPLTIALALLRIAPALLLAILSLLPVGFLAIALLLLTLLALLPLRFLAIALLLLTVLALLLLAIALRALPVLSLLLALLLLTTPLLLALLLLAALQLLALLPLRAMHVLPLPALLLPNDPLLLTLLHPRLLDTPLLHLTAAAAASHAATASSATLSIPARADINRAIGICAVLRRESEWGDCKRRNAKERGRDDRQARQTRQLLNRSHFQVPLNAPFDYCRSRTGQI